MGIILKTKEEIEQMRVAGQLAGDVLRMIAPHVQPGVTTGELDEICHRYITEEQQAIPAPLNYRGFPKSICTSVNDVICHGIPGDKVLKDGDIVNIDITAFVTIDDIGVHGDTDATYLVGDTATGSADFSRYDCRTFLSYPGPESRFIFTSDETGRPCVVYERDDGHVGLDRLAGDGDGRTGPAGARHKLRRRREDGGRGRGRSDHGEEGRTGGGGGRTRTSACRRGRRRSWSWTWTSATAGTTRCSSC